MCMPSSGIARSYGSSISSFLKNLHTALGFPGGSDGKSVCLQCRRPGFDPWVGKIPWRRKWQPTPSILAWKIPWTEEPGRLQSMGFQSWTKWPTEQTLANSRKMIGSKLKFVKLTPTESWELSDLGDFLKLCGFCYPKKKGNTGKIYDLVTRGIGYTSDYIFSPVSYKGEYSKRKTLEKTKILASGPITSWEIDGETVSDFILGGSKITADGDCSHEIKRHSLEGKLRST